MWKVLVGTVAWMFCVFAFSATGKIDSEKIEEITGSKGTYSAKENVFKITSPRTDIKIQVDGWVIHSHMSGEKPKILFMHYWGRGPAAQLAQSLRKVLDAQAKVGSKKMMHGG